MKIKYIWILALALIFQSCFVAKDYNRPELSTASQFRTGSIETDSSTLAAVSWRNFFEDPLLVSYIERALENNLDIRTAIQSVQIADAYAKQAAAGYYPTINAGLNHNFNFQKSRAENPSISGFDLSGNLAWEADIWGKIRSSKRAALADLLQSNYTHQTVATSLISAVANAYFNLVALDEQHAVALETIKNREEGIETNKALKIGGYVTEVAVNQNEALLVSAQTLLLDIENRIRLQENILTFLLGESSGSIARNSWADQALNLDVQLGFPIQLLENRPDVKAAELGLVKAFENVNVAKSNFYPALRITATPGFQNTNLGSLLNFNSFVANIISGLTQPVYNRRALKTQKEVATAGQEQAFLLYQKSILTAEKEVSDALFSYQNAVSKQGLVQKEYELHSQSLEFSEELLKNGMANYLEVITGKQNVLNSQLNLVSIKLQQLTSMVEIYRALGGGWQ